jgi:hypothetical protein
MDLSGDSGSRLRVPAIGIVLAMLLSLVATTAQAVPSQPGASTQAAQAARAPVFDNEFGKIKSRVVGTFGQNGTVDAVFKPKRFKVVGTQLMAIGKLQGELVRGNGKVVDDFSQRVKLPVATAGGLPLPPLPLLREGRAATCDILRLDLAPLELDLLGLVVNLDRVLLTIVAESGAGNLLGNLLCAVTGLLDSAGLAGVLGPVTQILNGILALLRQ